MFCVTLTETEGNVPVLQGTVVYEFVYVTARGIGWGRSPKIAVRMAKIALRRHWQEHSTKYPFGGTPVLNTKTIKKNGKTILDVCD